MANMQLTIVTPSGLEYDGEAEFVRVRATTGDVAILPKHIDYAAALGRGRAKIVADGKPREADIDGGMLIVSQDKVEILTSNFLWTE
ncbi:MAG: hypothetical protein E7317_11075 [Clostridiales bacterium]|nr:hypothetical protein [Clostridiales bacterium]